MKYSLLFLSIYFSLTTQAYPVKFERKEVGSVQVQSVDFSKSRATVVVFLSARCPCSASHEVELKALHQKYSNKGFSFVGIHSNHDETLDETVAHFKSANLPFPILEDAQTSGLAEEFKALKTPHVYLVNSEGKMLFEGGVDDSNNHLNASKHYLREALAALDAGKEPPLKLARALGCHIARPK